MNKHAITGLVALLLALLLAAPALADEDEALEDFRRALTEMLGTPAPTPAEAAFDEASAGYAGAWVCFEDGFRLYLPADWTYFELTEAERATGMFYRAGSGGAGETPAGVAVSCAEMGADRALDDLRRQFESAGYTGLALDAIHGIPVLRFGKPEDGYRGVAFQHALHPEYVLAIYVSPWGGAEAAGDDVGAAILASLTPWSCESTQN